MASLDLNLLRTFLAIYDAGSVKAAASNLSVTQPTVSYALAHLRQQLGDPLFVRGAQGMQPTLRAKELASVFRRAVDDIDEAADRTQRFDPATTQRIFRLCLSDLGELAFLPDIMRRIGESAPRAVVEVAPMRIDAVRQWLQDGEVDAAIASVALRGASQHRVLSRERYVCVLPTRFVSEAGPLTPDEFTALRHIRIDESAGHSQVEDLLSGLRIEREIGLHVHHFSVLPNLVLACDMLAIVPRRVALMFAETWPVAVRDLPIQLPTFDVSLYWNAAAGRTAALSWFLGELTHALTNPATSD